MWTWVLKRNCKLVKSGTVSAMNVGKAIALAKEATGLEWPYYLNRINGRHGIYLHHDDEEHVLTIFYP